MFQLVLITPEENHPLEAAIITEICQRFEVSIHIRKPSFSAEAYRTYLSVFDQQTIHRFVLHEHNELSDTFPVKGIHLKEKERLNVLKEPFHSGIISTSFHSILDLEGLKDPYSYVFFSPLFESISKQKYGSNTTDVSLRTTLEAIRKHTSIPVIGLGGIDEENVVRVKESGFDGGALLGAVWLSDDPVKTFERIWEKVNAGAKS
ncbi:MAG: thiamine phosphate synthase [Cytophagales bacterium]|nr:thiamine phosphate synthase [Cytophaga sp.]